MPLAQQHSETAARQRARKGAHAALLVQCRHGDGGHVAAPLLDTVDGRSGLRDGGAVTPRVQLHVPAVRLASHEQREGGAWPCYASVAVKPQGALHPRREELAGQQLGHLHPVAIKAEGAMLRWPFNYRVRCTRRGKSWPDSSLATCTSWPTCYKLPVSRYCCE